MQRTKITVGYTHTHNLGNYSNVRPSIVIEATLDEGDDPDQVKAQLNAEAVAYIHEAIDTALEREGKRAHFSEEPRYKLLSTLDVIYGTWNNRRTLSPPEQLVVILPMHVPLDDGRGTRRYSWWNALDSKVRLPHAYRIAANYRDDHEGYRVVDCSDGDLSKLPAWARELAPVEEPDPQVPAGDFFDDDDEGDDGPDNSQ